MAIEASIPAHASVLSPSFSSVEEEVFAPACSPLSTVKKTRMKASRPPCTQLGSMHWANLESARGISLDICIDFEQASSLHKTSKHLLQPSKAPGNAGTPGTPQRLTGINYVERPPMNAAPGNFYYAQTLKVDYESSENSNHQQDGVQLQIWAYETNNSRLTLAERLEKSMWEKARMERL